MEWTNKLLTSTAAIELEIRKQEEENEIRGPGSEARKDREEEGENEHRTSNIQHRTSNGKNIICAVFVENKKVLSVVGNLNDSAKLANDLAAKFAEYSKVSLGKSALVNKRQEARKLFYAYQFSKDINKLLAMHALDPDFKREAYFHGMRSYASSLSVNRKTLEKALDLSEYLIDLSEEWSNGKRYSPYAMYYVFNKYIINAANNLQNPKDLRKRAADLFLRNAGHIKKLLELQNGIEFDAGIKDFETYKKYTKLINAFTGPSCFNFGPSWEKHTYPLVKRWLEVSKSYKLPGKEDKYVLTENGKILTDRMLWILDGKYKSCGEQQKRQVREIFEIMLEHPIHALRIAGKSGIIKIKGVNEKYASKYWVSAAKEMANFAKEQIEELGKDKEYSFQKEWCYNIASQTVYAQLVDGKQYPSVAPQLFDFMYARKELSSSVVINTLFFLCVPYWEPKFWEHEKVNACIQKVFELCDSSDTHLLCSQKPKSIKWTKNSISKIIQAQLVNVYKYRPDLKKDGEADQKWVKVLSLEDLKFPPVIYKDKIWTVVQAEDGSQLVRINPEKGKVDPVKGQVIKSDIYNGIISENRFISLTNEGLIVFSLNNKFNPVLINKELNLGTRYGVNLSCIGDKLLITAGDNVFYTYLFDLKEKKLELISSSAEKEKRTSFSNISKAIEVNGIVADPEKQRFLMAVKSESRLQGIWQFDLKEKKWSKVYSPLDYVTMIKRNGKVLLFHGSIYCYEFDLKTDKARTVYFKHSYPYKKKNYNYPGMKKCKDHLGPAYLLTDQRFWNGGGLGAGYELSSVNLQTGKRNWGPKSSDRRGNIDYLNMIRNKFLIVGYQGGRYYFLKKVSNKKEK